MENYMGENGLAAEEEYKWGHYTCGEYEFSPTPQCARVAPHDSMPHPQPPRCTLEAFEPLPQLPATLRASTLTSATLTIVRDDGPPNGVRLRRLLQLG